MEENKITHGGTSISTERSRNEESNLNSLTRLLTNFNLQFIRVHVVLFILLLGKEYISIYISIYLPIFISIDLLLIMSIMSVYSVKKKKSHSLSLMAIIITLYSAVSLLFCDLILFNFKYKVP